MSFFKKRKNIKILIICAVVLIVIYKLFEYKAMNDYIAQPLPFYAQDKWTNKILYAESPKKIAASLLGSDENFRGDLKVNFLDYDKAEITMRNYATGDDTKEAIEYYVIAERKQPGWEITQFKMHWKCSRGYYWPRFWTTKGCI
jgi:hypothetical protein